jgi:hypothetical protein
MASVTASSPVSSAMVIRSIRIHSRPPNQAPKSGPMCVYMTPSSHTSETSSGAPGTKPSCPPVMVTSMARLSPQDIEPVISTSPPPAAAGRRVTASTSAEVISLVVSAAAVSASTAPACPGPPAPLEPSAPKAPPPEPEPEHAAVPASSAIAAAPMAALPMGRMISPNWWVRTDRLTTTSR